MYVLRISTLIWFIHSAMSNDVNEEMKYLKNHISVLTNQVMLQQFFSEQRVRSEGQSGLKLVRQRKSGTKSYFTETHTGYSAAAIHDHSNNIRTVGMGEFTGVLNGIEFRTRHNDYSLNMPHRTSKNYHATEPIAFPDVPPEVTSKTTVDEQVKEIREWFKSWRDQNHKKRDYRKYFKPVLCYLEGAWTTSGEDVDEPFASDRHFVDAKTWMELHEKARYVAYSGGKSLLENLSFLPTKIIGIKNGSLPVFAQWNYRVLCNPVSMDIPLNRLRVVEDLSSRMMTGWNIYKHMHSRAARFQLNVKNINAFFDRPYQAPSILDEIMEGIPGKDNYPGELYDEGLDAAVLNRNLKKKDVSRYHRWYRVIGKDAMGTSRLHRGYSDDFLFVARTTQSKIAGVAVRKCKEKKNPASCYHLKQKWSYAIPLELIFLTPLSSWNPYKLKYQGWFNRNNPAIKGGRTGSCEDGANKELNGTHSKMYYITPNEFYVGGQVGVDAADTTRGVTCVLDPDGKSHQVRAAGIHVFLPYIKEVGVLRQRYPIFPVHGEGSSVWKELSALREVLMDSSDKWSSMRWSHNNIVTETNSGDTELATGVSRIAATITTPHVHDVELTAAEVLQCRGGRDIIKTTSIANSHEHEVKIRWISSGNYFMYVECDGNPFCYDRHDRRFTIVKADDEASA